MPKADDIRTTWLEAATPALGLDEEVSLLLSALEAGACSADLALLADSLAGPPRAARRGPPPITSLVQPLPLGPAAGADVVALQRLQQLHRLLLAADVGITDLAALLAELGKLLAKLGRMRDGFAEDPQSAVAGGVSAVGLFLGHVVRQRRAAGRDIPSTLADPFMHLAGALLSLGDGAVDPLLAPRRENWKPGTKPPVTIPEVRARAEAAAAMQALMTVDKDHYSRERAARFVAQRLEGSPLLAGAKGAMAWRVVKGWRDEIVAPRKRRRSGGGEPRLSQEPEAGNELAAGHYRHMVKVTTDRIASGEWSRARVEELVREQCAALCDVGQAARKSDSRAATMSSGT